MADTPTLFLLHFLGGSARGWRATVERLGNGLRTVAVDLPGFGDAAAVEGFSVAAMTDHVAQFVRAEKPGRWLLVGHSMGAKVATALARRAENGENGLSGLKGLVTVAGSPPAPEPMSEKRRAEMLGWFRGGAESSDAQAGKFVDANAVELTPDARALAVADVLRADKAAWRAWLESGSKEDRRETVGLLATPALIVSGEKDGDLGPDAQRRLMAPHFAQARTAVVKDVRHLIPLEAPDALAALIREFAADALDPYPPPLVDAEYAAMLRSNHVTTRLREALEGRGKADDPDYRPVAVSPAELSVLRAACARIVPQVGEGRIDLAARIDGTLGDGDGWRHAGLPPDAEAFRRALRTLDRAAREIFGAGFGAIGDEERDALLEGIAAGKALIASRTADGSLDAGQMALWFEDFRALAARLYVAHPATLARMRYTGVANGGDGLGNFTGFERVGIGERDAWEPKP